MTIKIIKAERNSNTRPTPNSVVLVTDNWDDFSFKTLFVLYFYDQLGVKHDIGNVKIGYVGQKSGFTSDMLPQSGVELPDNFFSLGQDVDYYKNINKMFVGESKQQILNALRDVIYIPELFARAESEAVFSASLMREISPSTVNNQYKRVINGEVALSEFKFSYKYAGDDKRAAVDLAFEVKPGSKPPTNIHVLIGRNGVGKTTLLNNITTVRYFQNKSS